VYLDPGAHVIYAFEFAFKFGCDTNTTASVGAMSEWHQVLSVRAAISLTLSLVCNHTHDQ
jgi:hypothetical protein